MENFIDTPINQTASKTQVKEFFTDVYTYMFMAMVVSGVVSWYLASSGLFMEWFMTEEGAVSPLFYVVAFCPLALVSLIQAKYQSFSLSAFVGRFGLYSSLIGASLASIFFVYSMGDIAITPLVTAGAFGELAFLGPTTSVDLSKIG